MAAQRRLALGIGTRLQIGGHFLQHLYVWLDAFRLDGTTGRREITCRGQPQRPITRSERHDRLHRTFAERARADERRALLILQRTGDDFRGRSRTAVDQDDDRLALSQIARVGIEALGLLGITAAGGDDLALVQERIRDRNRLIEQATRIVAQIDDEPFDLVGSRAGWSDR